MTTPHTTGEPGASATGEGSRYRANWPYTFWLLFVFFWLLFLIVFRSQPFNDPGALWHIRVGDHIFAHGFPHTDPFTWSHAGKPWIPQQWGAECVMSLLHRIGGFDALLASMGALLAGLAAWLTKRFMDSGLHWLPAGLIVAFGMAVAGFHFYLRPHIATIVLMAVVMAWIVDFEGGRSGWQRFLWLIPLCIVWTNLHGGVLGGIFTFGLGIGGWVIMRRIAMRTAAWMIVLFVACIVSTLINPFGIEMHRTWWSIVGSDILKEYITEHQPLSLARSDGKAVVAFGGFYFIMLLGTLPKRPRISWLIPLVWFGLSVTSIRHGPLFCAVALVALADLFPETIWFRLLRKYGDTFATEPTVPIHTSAWKACSLPIVLILISLGLHASRVAVPLIGYGWGRFDQRIIPVELIEPLQVYAQSKPDGFPIYNDANLGGFLIYFTPSLKVFMDDRCELYGDAGIRDYIDMQHHHPERIEEWAARVPFDRALVEYDADPEKQSAMYQYLERNKDCWECVARGQKAVLFKRIK